MICWLCQQGKDLYISKTIHRPKKKERVAIFCVDCIHEMDETASAAAARNKVLRDLARGIEEARFYGIRNIVENA